MSSCHSHSHSPDKVRLDPLPVVSAFQYQPHAQPGGADAEEQVAGGIG